MQFRILILMLSLIAFKASLAQLNKTYIVTYSIYDAKNEFNSIGRLVTNDTISQWAAKSRVDTMIVTDSGRRFIRPSGGYRGFVYKNRNTNKSCFEQSPKVGALKKLDIYYTDTIYPMNWVLVGGSKKVGGRECLKALTVFRGRAYTAWYAPDIPLSEGPWKFGGLPGLILEVYDSDNYQRYTLSSFTEAAEIGIPAMPTTVGNYNDFKKATKAALKKVIAELEAKDEVNPECPTCGTSKVKIETIENILED